MSETILNKLMLEKAVSAILDEMSANRDYLIELDQQNGDGDLGISMNDGFANVKACLASTSESDLGKLFQKSANAFNEAAPSSLGTILTLGFMGMAKALKGKQTANFAEFAQAFSAGLERIMERAGSKPGEKTILDALYPAAQCYLNEADQPETAVQHALKAALEGSESTRQMIAVHGRAARYGEKSIGMLDGGSVVGMLIAKGIAHTFE